MGLGRHLVLCSFQWNRISLKRLGKGGQEPISWEVCSIVPETRPDRWSKRYTWGSHPPSENGRPTNSMAPSPHRIDSAEKPLIIFSGPSRGWEPPGGPASSQNGPGFAIGYTRRPGGPARRPGAWGCSRIIWRLGPRIESQIGRAHV